MWTLLPVFNQMQSFIWQRPGMLPSTGSHASLLITARLDANTRTFVRLVRYTPGRDSVLQLRLEALGVGRLSQS